MVLQSWSALKHPFSLSLFEVGAFQLVLTEFFMASGVVILDRLEQGRRSRREQVHWWRAQDGLLAFISFFVIAGGARNFGSDDGACVPRVDAANAAE